MPEGQIIDAFVLGQWGSQHELAGYLSREWQAYLTPSKSYTVPLFPMRRPYSNPAGDFVEGYAGLGGEPLEDRGT